MPSVQRGRVVRDRVAECVRVSTRGTSHCATHISTKAGTVPCDQYRLVNTLDENTALIVGLRLEFAAKPAREVFPCLGPTLALAAMETAVQELVANSKEQVKAYVKASDHLQFSWLAQGMVQLNVSHSNLRQFVQELRLDLHTTIAEVKRKLYTHNGSSIGHMELQLKDGGGNLLCRMLDDDRMLGFYGAQNGMTIHVLDTDPFSLSRDGGLDDVSRIEKYRMSEDDYEQRENTYRAFKKKMLTGNPNWRPLHASGGANKPVEAYLEEACAAGITLGSRCSIPPGDRRGEVAFVGLVPELAPGFWVGIVLDEPVGKNDGTYKGTRYFEAADKYGSFVRPDLVTVGNYPPLWDEELEAEGKDDEI